MSSPGTLSIDWDAHPRCRQCDKHFEDDLPRAAAIMGLKVAGVFHEHCWPVFEAALGHKVHTIVPYPLDSTKGSR
jgi:hypothetical protein